MEFLFLSGIIIAGFLAFMLLTKTDKDTADYILAAWLCATAYGMFAYYLIYTNQHVNYPTLTAIGMPLPLMQGPFLLLYTKYQTSRTSFKRNDFLHFIPVLLSYTVLFGPFYLMTLPEKIEIFRHEGSGYETQTLINTAGIYLSGLIYIAVTLNKLIRYRKNLKNEFSNTERINYNWLLYLLIGLGIIWIIVLFVQDDTFIYAAAAIYILCLGYFGIRQVNIFGQKNFSLKNESFSSGLVATYDPGLSAMEVPATESTTLPDQDQIAAKYHKSSLNEEDVLKIHQRLIRALQEQKPYLDPELTLGELARRIDIHPNYLSQVINSKENKNFYDLINEKRIAEFLKQVKDPRNRQYTFLALAFNCGFNSKASFNRNFKKYTGHSPSEFLLQEN